MKKFFQLSFLPTHVDLGLLVLRLTFGGSMVLLHGWGKIAKFETLFDTFPDPIGLGSRASYVLAAGGEFLGASLIVLGLFTRFAALWVGVVMAIAFFVAHGAVLSGPRSGEMALLYLGAFLVLLTCGGGRYSLDARIGHR